MDHLPVILAGLATLAFCAAAAVLLLSNPASRDHFRDAFLRLTAWTVEEGKEHWKEMEGIIRSLDDSAMAPERKQDIAIGQYIEWVSSEQRLPLRIVRETSRYMEFARPTPEQTQAIAKRFFQVVYASLRFSQMFHLS